MRKLVFLLSITGIILTVFSQKHVRAQSDGLYERGLQLYSDRSYREAYTIFNQLAVKGDPVSQNTLGIMYNHGLGVPKNYKRAGYWFNLASEAGQVDAIVNLAFLMMSSKLGPPDYTRVAGLFQRAADIGDPRAQHALALMYLRGDGLIPDENKAFELLLLASNQNYQKADRDLQRFFPADQ